MQGLQAPAPVDHSPNDQVWRDEELARAVQVTRPLNTCDNAFRDGMARMTSAAHSCLVNASILGTLSPAGLQCCFSYSNSPCTVLDLPSLMARGHALTIDALLCAGAVGC